MRTLIQITLTLALVGIVSCGGQPTPTPEAEQVSPLQKQLLGKWTFADAAELSMEFIADGTCVMGPRGNKAKYQVAGDSLLVITGPDGSAERFKASVAQDELILAEAEEQSEPAPKIEGQEKEVLKLKRAK